MNWVYATTSTPNQADHEGIGPINATIRNGRRCSSAQAFLAPARSRPNLTVLTGAVVTRIGFEQGRAVGVSGVIGGRSTEYRATREVVLCAGALNTPKLLQTSGVGSRGKLSALGIPVIADRPGVGENLREHVVLIMQFRLSGNYSQNAHYSGYRVILHGLRYLLSHSGLMATPPYDIAAFVKTRPGIARPDAQLVAAPMSVDLKAWKGFSGGIKLEDEPGAQILGYALQPQSQGSVHIRTADSASPLDIIHNFLTHSYDREVAIATIRYMRKLFNQPAIRPYIKAETLPGIEVESDEGILEFCKKIAGPGYHVAGTCKMGHDSMSVVDERLRVRGIAGLRNRGPVSCSDPGLRKYQRTCHGHRLARFGADSGGRNRGETTRPPCAAPPEGYAQRRYSIPPHYTCYICYATIKE